MSKRALLERLEARRLLHGGLFDLHVNFQPASAAVPSGYLADGGLAYGDRGNGFTYGWDAANTTATRDRNVLADQRYDTFIHTQAYGVRTWEAAVPNGQYTVHLVAGDASYYDSIYKLNVEGVLSVSGTPTSGSRFVEGTQTVTVADGRLTISNAAGSSNNKIAFVEIDSVDAPLSTVSVASTDASASESGDTATFLFTRSSEDTAEPLDVKFSIGGSASDGTDYVQLMNVVTIPAGQTTATVTLTPIDDVTPEASETVTLTILSDPTYLVGGANSATATIADNDGAAPFAAKINFQPAGAALPAGYLPDAGNVFADRGNGYSYGWSGDDTTQSRDRNSPLSPDQRYDTLVQFNGKSWELAVPAGTYAVHVVAGDAAYLDSIYKIDAEGMRVVDGTPTSANHWVEGTALIAVSDGKLTIGIGSGASNDKICFIEVTAASPNTPILSVTAPTTNASESGPTPRSHPGVRFQVPRE